MLDGEEFIELRNQYRRDIKHYLLVDDRFTWWNKGKSYLCRIIDLMHMGLVDEVLFGKEVVTRWPEIVQSWRNIDYVRPDIRPKLPKMLKEKRAGFKTLWNS